MDAWWFFLGGDFPWGEGRLAIWMMQDVGWMMHDDL